MDDGMPNVSLTRSITLNLEEIEPGTLRFTGLSFQGMPQGEEGLWTTWKLTHDFLLMAAKFAHDKMLEDMQSDTLVKLVRPGNISGSIM